MNPWEQVPLGAYEAHMSAPKVGQLQALSQIMRRQLEKHLPKTVCVLGVAGGNGLEHIHPDRTHKVYGIDISTDYLNACAQRFAALGDTLTLQCMDLTDGASCLPQAELVIANLLIEYVGVERFAQLIASARPAAVCCAVQASTDAGFVSASPCAAALQCLNAVHKDVEPGVLTAAMARIGYMHTLQEEYLLPNDKRMICMDFAR